MKNVGSGSKTTILSYSEVNLGMYFSKKMFSKHSETFLNKISYHEGFLKENSIPRCIVNIQ